MKRKLQVFVSSTFTDLIPERQAAVSAILKAGHIPAGMELFTAGDQSQMEIIERWIDESDVYMLLLGGRYGSVEPKSGMGYTELEYDYATQQGKPVFAVVMREEAIEQKVKDNGTSFIEKVHPTKLDDFRKKVLGNISSFFQDEKDIKLAVYESLSDFSANRNLKGWVSGDEVADSRILQNEIARLQDENSGLKAKLSELESKKAPMSGRSSNDDFSDIEAVLKEISIDIPESITNGEKKSNTLLNIFYHTKDTFVNGITNQAGMSDAHRFLFFNVAPKLKIYGLVENEKVTGKVFRRVFATPKGLAFLAKLEREQIARGKEVSASSEQDAVTAAI